MVWGLTMNVKRAFFIIAFGLCSASGLMAKVQPDRPLHGTWDFKPRVEWKVDGAGKAGKEALQYGTLLVDEQGQIWYLDLVARRVHLFSAQGSWMRSFGRTGKGPGDLDGPWSLFMVGEDLAVNESERVSFFSQEGRFRASERMLVQGLQAFGCVGGQRLACRTNFNSEPVNGKETVGIFDPATTRFQKLIDFPAQEYIQKENFAFQARSVQPGPVVSCDGQRVVCGFSGTYAIHVFGADGGKITTIEMDRKRPPISLAEREELVNGSSFVKNTGLSTAKVAYMLPSTYTHFNRLFADPGGAILVQCPHAQSARMARLDLFGPQGTYLYRAMLRLPVEGEIVTHAIAPGRWVVIVEDDAGDIYLLHCSLNWPTQWA